MVKYMSESKAMSKLKLAARAARNISPCVADVLVHHDTPRARTYAGRE